MPGFAKISLSACPQDAFRRGRLSALTLVLTVSLTGSPWESLRTTGAQTCKNLAAISGVDSIFDRFA